MAREAIMDVFKETFTERYGAALASIRPEELQRAEELVAEKFGTRSWTARVL
jgi:lipoate---protein ligase